MSYQRDYVLRMIEMMGDFILALLGKIKKKDFESASEMIDNAYQEMLKEDAAFFDRIPLEKLAHELLNEHNYTNGHLEILGDLFYAQGELLLAQGNEAESKRYYVKARYLIEYVMADTKVFSFDKQERLSKIEMRLRQE